MPTVQPGVIVKITDKEGILGCINEHDGSGYLHALLEAYHPGYARLQSSYYRTNLAKSIRIGALPTILRTRYGSDPLCREGCTEARTLFNKSIAFGSPLPEVLLQDYAQYLGVPYQLYDADFKLIEEYNPPGKKIAPCRIISTTEDEYHLVVKILSQKSPGSVKYQILH